MVAFGQKPIEKLDRERGPTRRPAVRPVIAIASLVLLLVACGEGETEPESDTAAPSVSGTDVESGAPTLNVETFDTGFSVGALAVAPDAVWVSDEADAVQRIDPATGQAITDGQLLISDVSAVAVMDGVLWTGSTVDLPVTRLDVESGERTETATPRSVADIAVMSTSVWVNDDLVDAALRLDPTTLEVIGSVPVGLPTGLAATEASVWVTDENGGVVQIDPTTSQVVSTADLVPGLSSVAATESAAWVADSYEITRMDPATGQAAAPIELPETIGSISGLAANDEGLWVISYSEDAGPQVSLVAEDTNSVVASVELDGSPGYIAAGDAGVWVSYEESTTISHIVAS